MKVVAVSISHLESLITRLSAYGQTTSFIVLSSPVTKQIIEPEAGKAGQVAANA